MRLRLSLSMPFTSKDCGRKHLKMKTSRLCLSEWLRYTNVHHLKGVIFYKLWRIAKLLDSLPEWEQSVVLVISRHFCTLRMNFVKTVLSSLIVQQESKPVQMMYRTGSFKVAEVAAEKLKILEIPYAGGQLSLLALLPDETSDLEQVWSWKS